MRPIAIYVLGAVVMLAACRSADTSAAKGVGDLGAGSTSAIDVRCSKIATTTQVTIGFDPESVVYRANDVKAIEIPLPDSVKSDLLYDGANDDLSVYDLQITAIPGSYDGDCAIVVGDKRVFSCGLEAKEGQEVLATIWRKLGRFSRTYPLKNVEFNSHRDEDKFRHRLYLEFASGQKMVGAIRSLQGCTVEEQ